MLCSLHLLKPPLTCAYLLHHFGDMAVFLVKGGDGSLKTYQVESGKVYGSLDEVEVADPSKEALAKMSRPALKELCSELGVWIADFDKANRQAIAECIVRQFNDRKEAMMAKAKAKASSSNEDITEKTIKVHKLGRSSGFCDIYTSQGDVVEGFRMTFVEGIPHFISSYGCYEIDDGKTLEDILKRNNVLFFKDDDSGSDGDSGSDEGSDGHSQGGSDGHSQGGSDGHSKGGSDAIGDISIPLVLNEESEELKFKGIIEVKNNSVDVAKFIHFYYGKDTTFDNLIAMVQENLGIDCGLGGAYVIQWKGNSPITNAKWETIHSWTCGYNESVFTLNVRNLGGGLIRNHLTKDKAKEMLKAKAVKVVQEHQEIGEVVFPQSFTDFEADIRDKLSEIKVLVNQGVPVFKMALRGLSDTNLKVVQDIMKKPLRGNRGDGSEQQFLQVMDYIVPSLSLLNNGTKSLQNLHSEFSRALLQIYVDVYGQYADGAMKFGNAQLLKEIETEIELRTGAQVVNVPSNCCVIV
eukprot:s2392_g9.t1